MLDPIATPGELLLHLPTLGPCASDTALQPERVHFACHASLKAMHLRCMLVRLSRPLSRLRKERRDMPVQDVAVHTGEMHWQQGVVQIA